MLRFWWTKWKVFRICLKKSFFLVMLLAFAFMIHDDCLGPIKKQWWRLFWARLILHPPAMILLGTFLLFSCFFSYCCSRLWAFSWILIKWKEKKSQKYKKNECLQTARLISQYLLITTVRGPMFHDFWHSNRCQFTSDSSFCSFHHFIRT